jgi:orotate phosphoribosyltransferase
MPNNSTPSAEPGSTAQSFVRFAIETGVLQFGTFTTKSGRQSPYFFNAGLFDSGASLLALGDAYAAALIESGVEFDMLFGPAYKGITLAAATAVGLARRGRDVPFAYNRKEAKDHGEGGLLVGAPLVGRVVIVDDVITDGAAKRESVEIIRATGASPCAVLIALDRQERVTDAADAPSSVQAFERLTGVPVISIIGLTELFAYLSDNETWANERAAVSRYRSIYGVGSTIDSTIEL